MKHIILLVIIFTYGLMLLLQPLIAPHSLFFSQPIRARIMHILFRNRIWLFSLVQSRTNISAGYRALEEMIRLHDRPFYMERDPDLRDILEFRLTARNLFRALYPKYDNKNCWDTLFLHKRGNREVFSHSINYGGIRDWTNPSHNFILYLHGGGFVYGDSDVYEGYECYLSRLYDMPVVHIDYGLVPESNLSTIMENVLTVYLSMLSYDPEVGSRMIGMGDSSGGLLWLRLIQLVVEQNQPSPLAVVLMSPWMSTEFIDCEQDSNTKQKRSLFSLYLVHTLTLLAVEPSRDSVPNLLEVVSQELDRWNPMAHSFVGFPPLYVTVGTEELFLPQAWSLQRKILENNGRIVLEEGYGLMHAYPMFHLWSYEAERAQLRIKSFIEQILIENDRD